MNPVRPLSAPRTILWLLAFAAVLSHLPAVGFDFAQDDFASLARAMGDPSATAAGARWFTTTATWSALWPLFGNDPAPYHGLSLLLLAGVTVVAAGLAFRLRAGAAGAVVAGLLVLLGPTTAIPVAWVSASNELWAALFALVALDRAAVAGSSRALVIATAAALLSVMSKESALAIGPALWIVGRHVGADEDAGLRRARGLLAVVVTLAAVHAAWRVVDTLGGGTVGAYRIADAGGFLLHLLRVLGWAVWPVSVDVAPAAVTAGIGGVALLVFAGAAWIERRRGSTTTAWLFAAALATALPAALVARGPEPYHALLPSVVVAIAIARAVGPAVGSRLTSRELRASAVVLGAVATVALAGTGIDTRLHARGENGQLVHPVLRRTTVVHTARTQFDTLQRARPQPTAIGVLQATRAAFDPVPHGDGRAVFVGSPLYLALDGDRGLAVLSVGGPETRWITNVDEVPEGGFVFLDPGDAVLRPLGPPSNARIYTALIAVAAGQYQRARHDLWGVIADQGIQVRFSFDPAHLPIRPEELDAEAEGFARFLVRTTGDDGTTSNTRLLRLFEEIYETVRGKELVRDLGDLESLRSPRFDQ